MQALALQEVWAHCGVPTKVKTEATLKSFWKTLLSSGEGDFITNEYEQAKEQQVKHGLALTYAEDSISAPL